MINDKKDRKTVIYFNVFKKNERRGEKMKNIKRIAAIVLACMSVVGVSGCQNKNPNDSTGDNGDVPSGIQMKDDIVLKDVERAKNVILLIGDGMGRNHVHAGEVYNESKLAMQNFPYSVHVETCSYDAEVTDSAAGATAMATGKRTNNGCVALDPITEEPLETIVDIAASLGKRTGVITTDELTGATPMGFASHSALRGSVGDLFAGIKSSNVNLFISNDFSGEVNVMNAGYKKIGQPANISEATEEKIYGIYNIMAYTKESMHVGKDYCSFDGIVTEALEYLSKDEDGFFLMAEGALIDKRSHSNSFERMLWELMSFDNMVKAVVNWAENRDDTVVIVTADHETGGLQLAEGITKKNMFYGTSFANGGYYQWSSGEHTSDDVYCFINGANIDFSQYSFNSASRIKNTDIFYIMKALLGV